MSADPAVLAQDIQRLEIELAERQQELAGLKRRLEPEPVKDYTLAGWSGPISLSELFRGKEDLILIHNMGRGCRYCTLWADGFNGVWRHLADRAGFAVCSPDPVEVQREFAAGRAWTFPMVSAHGTTFIQDMGFRSEKSWMPGVSTFRKSAGGSIERIARAGFGPFDPFCPVWPLIALLADGANGWEPRFRYAD